MKEDIKFTMYIPKELNEQIEFLRYKERLNKNKIILNALVKYLPEQLKKYPEYKGVKKWTIIKYQKKFTHI